MAEMLLINPRKRRATKRKTTAKRVIRRKRNPVAAYSASKRRRNPIAAMKKRVMRRRRNPIGGGMMGGYMGAIREAVMGGAGAVAMDVVYGQIKGFLPASLQRVPGNVGAGDAVKAIVTVALGQVLNKATRGFSKKAASASLTVQAHEIIRGFVPASMALGYASPAMIAQGSTRVGPIRRGVNAYSPAGGATPMLSAYTQTGQSQSLSRGVAGARMREGVTAYR